MKCDRRKFNSSFLSDPVSVKVARSGIHTHLPAGAIVRDGLQAVRNYWAQSRPRVPDSGLETPFPRTASETFSHNKLCQGRFTKRVRDSLSMCSNHYSMDLSIHTGEVAAQLEVSVRGRVAAPATALISACIRGLVLPVIAHTSYP